MNAARISTSSALAAASCSAANRAASAEQTGLNDESIDLLTAAQAFHARTNDEVEAIRRQVDGRIHRCSLELKRLREADQWLDHYRVFWSGSLDALAQYVEGE